MITQVEIEPGTDDDVDAYHAAILATDRYLRSFNTNKQYPATVGLDEFKRQSEAIQPAVQTLRDKIRDHLEGLER